MTSIWKLLVSTLLILGITACTRYPNYIMNPTDRNLTPHQHRMLADIEHSGIQVIKQGMVYKFVIPTDCFFVKETRQLKSHRGRILDELSNFIRSYMSYFVVNHISVKGYTDKVWLMPQRQLLSLHYAQTIAEFFLEDGIDSSLITIKGEGAKHPIASNQYPMGTAFNRRVVVEVS